MTAPNQAVAVRDLHAEIMNLPCIPPIPDPEALDDSATYAYKIGHRDARHAAAELVAQPQQAVAAPAEPMDGAYSYAVGLATSLFQKHYANDPDYASGRIVWEPLNDVAGVLTQIDNMVSGLAQPASTPVVVGDETAIEEIVTRLESLLDMKNQSWALAVKRVGEILAASKAKPADVPVGVVPSYQFTDGSLTLQEEVADAIGVYARSKPDDGEDWESWFEAAFDLAVARVRAVFEEFKQREELASHATPAPALSGVTDAGGRCPNCDGSGDVHRVDGEWLGKCDCSMGTSSGVTNAEVEFLAGQVVELRGYELIAAARRAIESFAASRALPGADAFSASGKPMAGAFHTEIEAVAHLVCDDFGIQPGNAVSRLSVLHIRSPQPARAQGDAKDARINWPKENRVGRREDMSPDGTLIVGLDSDNDVYIEVSGERHGQWQSAAVEFCNGGGGGGQSSRTRAALVNLMTAIEADNEEYPHKAFPGTAIAAIRAQGGAA